MLMTPKRTHLKVKAVTCVWTLCAALSHPLLTAAWASPENLLAQQFYQRGMTLREENSLDRAEHFLKKALEIDPANSAYHFELANLYASRYDHLAAKRIRDERAQAWLAHASRELESAVMLDPHSIPARFNLGVVYKKQGMYEEARQNFRDILEREPNLTNAYLQIASTYEEQGFYDEAEDTYRKAQELDFGNPGIELAIEELKTLRQEAAVRARREAGRSQDFLLRGRFARIPQSHLASQSEERYRELDAQTGLQQAIPYLSLWLVDQFMKLRNPDDE